MIIIILLKISLKIKKSIYINPMTESVFTSNINMSKKVKDNIKYLNLHAKYFKPDVKPMVNELVKYYERVIAEEFN